MKEAFATMGIAITIYLVVAAVVTACSGDVDHNVKGRTAHEVKVTQDFCDEKTYPTVEERRVCKDKLLEAMRCR